MLFETDNTYIDVAGRDDVNSIVEIYNSNRGFLMAHIDRQIVNTKWVEDEIATMKGIGFLSCKVVHKGSDTSVGILDFAVKEESYLSLLVLHADYRNSGLGSEVYRGFEHFAKEHKSKRIRIEVVTSYDRNVLDFWVSKGFSIDEKVELNWSGKILPAVTMRKDIG